MMHHLQSQLVDQLDTEVFNLPFSSMKLYGISVGKE